MPYSILCLLGFAATSGVHAEEPSSVTPGFSVILEDPELNAAAAIDIEWQISAPVDVQSWFTLEQFQSQAPGWQVIAYESAANSTEGLRFSRVAGAEEDVLLFRVTWYADLNCLVDPACAGTTSNTVGIDLKHFHDEQFIPVVDFVTDSSGNEVLGEFDGNINEPFVGPDDRWLFFSTYEPDKDNHLAIKIGEGAYLHLGELGTNTAEYLEGNPTMDNLGNFYFVDSQRPGMVSRGLVNPNLPAVLTDLQAVAGLPAATIGEPYLCGEFACRNNDLTISVEVNAAGDILFFSRAHYLEVFNPSAALQSVAVLAGDIFMTKKLADGQFHLDLELSNYIMQAINTPNKLEYAAGISADGKNLFFTRSKPLSSEQAVLESKIMWASRADITQPFQTPLVVGRIAKGFVEGPKLSADGNTLYYHRSIDERGTFFRLYRVVRR